MACTGCSSGACSRLGVTDWLADMLPPASPQEPELHELRFKTTRKAYYQNPQGLELITGDCVVVEADRGYDVGMVTLGGELARLQVRKKKVPAKEILKVLRIASPTDLQKLEQARAKEHPTLVRAREIILKLKLEMKLSDVEYQGDGLKASFYYTAEQRVDFRELIKLLAHEFRIRVEMRQIGLRQEAAIVGGVGTCGRELCCSSWLTDFKTVNTTAARYQNISLNPGKITGQCGRLKCCLNYELDTYLDAIKDIPQVRELHTEVGVALLQKMDIFKRTMWFTYGGDANWTAVTLARVVEVQAMNKQGMKPPHLNPVQEDGALPPSLEPDFVDVVGQSNLHERLLMARKSKKHRTVVRPARPRGEDGRG